MRKIFLLTDYRGQFYSSTKHRGASVDLNKLEEFFAKGGFEFVRRPFSEVDFRTQSYKNEWVLYQSSEDPGLFYRSYIDDIITGLFMQGAYLIPNFYQFKAHHNKHFMEILRDTHTLPEVKNIQARRYGTYEDYLKDRENFNNETHVLKSSSSSKSKGVFLLKGFKDKVRLPKFISKTPTLQNLRYFFEWLKTRRMPVYISNNRRKFIVQPYISNLQGDYRVVVYNKKYFVLYRANRTDDFRASGSMKFDYNVDLPEGLLDYSRRVFESFNVPYIALDIGIKEGVFYLFEFQFLSFGQYTLEKSNFFYFLENGAWKRILEKPDLEREISTSVISFIEKHQELCVE